MRVVTCVVSRWSSSFWRWFYEGSWFGDLGVWGPPGMLLVVSRRNWTRWPGLLVVDRYIMAKMASPLVGDLSCFCYDDGAYDPFNEPGQIWPGTTFVCSQPHWLGYCKIISHFGTESAPGFPFGISDPADSISLALLVLYSPNSNRKVSLDEFICLSDILSSFLFAQTSERDLQSVPFPPGSLERLPLLLNVFKKHDFSSSCLSVLQEQELELLRRILQEFLFQKQPFRMLSDLLRASRVPTSDYDSDDDSAESDSEDDFSGRVDPLMPFMGDHMNNHLGDGSTTLSETIFSSDLCQRDSSVFGSPMGTNSGDGFIIFTENTPFSDTSSDFESDSDFDDDLTETAESLPTFLLPETTLQSNYQTEDDSIGRADPLLQFTGNQVDNTACRPAVGRPPRREGDRPLPTKGGGLKFPISSGFSTDFPLQDDQTDEKARYPPGLRPNLVQERSPIGQHSSDPRSEDDQADEKARYPPGPRLHNLAQIHSATSVYSPTASSCVSISRWNPPPRRPMASRSFADCGVHGRKRCKLTRHCAFESSPSVGVPLAPSVNVTVPAVA